MSRHPLQIHVSPHDQKELHQVLNGGLQSVRVVYRALALLHLSEGSTAPQVAQFIKKLTPKAVRVIAHRYQRGGFSAHYGFLADDCAPFWRFFCTTTGGW